VSTALLNVMLSCVYCGADSAPWLVVQVLGNAKGVVAALISLAIFKNPVTNKGAVGYAVTVIGVILYSEVCVGVQMCCSAVCTSTLLVVVCARPGGAPHCGATTALGGRCRAAACLLPQTCVRSSRQPAAIAERVAAAPVPSPPPCTQPSAIPSSAPPSGMTRCLACLSLRGGVRVRTAPCSVGPTLAPVPPPAHAGSGLLASLWPRFPAGHAAARHQLDPVNPSQQPQSGAWCCTLQRCTAITAITRLPRKCNAQHGLAAVRKIRPAPPPGP
jgi:hypothetical protein